MATHTATKREGKMEKATYTVMMYGDTYSLRANWADAGSAIERETEDGWMATGRQVADYSHSSSDAMRDELEQSVVASGDLPEECADEIDRAIKGMV